MTNISWGAKVGTFDLKSVNSETLTQELPSKRNFVTDFWRLSPGFHEKTHFGIINPGEAVDIKRNVYSLLASLASLFCLYSRLIVSFPLKFSLSRIPQTPTAIKIDRRNAFFQAVSDFLHLLGATTSSDRRENGGIILSHALKSLKSKVYGDSDNLTAGFIILSQLTFNKRQEFRWSS